MTQADSAHIATERAFLHEVCNALAVSHGFLSLILMKAKNAAPDQNFEDLVARVEKALHSLDKVNNLVLSRRSIILANSEPTTPRLP